jgi:hypothetical protein
MQYIWQIKWTSQIFMKIHHVSLYSCKITKLDKTKNKQQTWYNQENTTIVRDVVIFTYKRIKKDIPMELNFGTDIENTGIIIYVLAIFHFICYFTSGAPNVMMVYAPTLKIIFTKWQRLPEIMVQRSRCYFYRKLP